MAAGHVHSRLTRTDEFHVSLMIRVRGRRLGAELSLPKSAEALGVSIVHDERKARHRRMSALLAKIHLGTLTLYCPTPLSPGEVVGIVEWVRSRKLFQRLPVGIIAAGDPRTVLKAPWRKPIGAPESLKNRLSAAYVDQFAVAYSA